MSAIGEKRPADEQLQNPDNKLQKTEADTAIVDLTNKYDAEKDENKRAEIVYNLNKAFDEKYAQYMADTGASEQLRKEPTLSGVALNFDMQKKFVLEAMRSASFSPDVKQLYEDRFNQLQDAEKKLVDLNNQIRIANTTELQQYYTNEITSLIGEMESRSVLKNPDVLKKFGDQIADEQALIQQSFDRYSMIQAIFSPTTMNMADPRAQLNYSVLSGDRRRGRRKGEAPYDFSKLPMLVDTVTMAKDVFDREAGDKRNLFDSDLPLQKFSNDLKEKYAAYIQSKYDNVIEDKTKQLLTKKPEDMTAEDLADFAKFRDAYVVENDYKHYIVTRDDPQWLKEDADQFARQIREQGNEYYEPKSWEVGISWTVGALGLALGIAAFPLGLSTAVGSAAMFASAGFTVASMGMPPVGGPEWLHKTYMALSLTVGGATLLYGGFLMLPTRFQAALTPAFISGAASVAPAATDAIELGVLGARGGTAASEASTAASGIVRAADVVADTTTIAASSGLADLARTLDFSDEVAQTVAQVERVAGPPAQVAGGTYAVVDAVEDLAKLSPKELTAKLQDIKKLLQNRVVIPDRQLRATALSVVNNALGRNANTKQMIGAIISAQGKISAAVEAGTSGLARAVPQVASGNPLLATPLNAARTIHANAPVGGTAFEAATEAQQDVATLTATARGKMPASAFKSAVSRLPTVAEEGAEFFTPAAQTRSVETPFYTSEEFQPAENEMTQAVFEYQKNNPQLFYNELTQSVKKIRTPWYRKVVSNVFQARPAAEASTAIELEPLLTPLKIGSESEFASTEALRLGRTPIKPTSTGATAIIEGNEVSVTAEQIDRLDLYKQATSKQAMLRANEYELIAAKISNNVLPTVMETARGGAMAAFESKFGSFIPLPKAIRESVAGYVTDTVLSIATRNLGGVVTAENVSHSIATVQAMFSERLIQAGMNVTQAERLSDIVPVLVSEFAKMEPGVMNFESLLDRVTSVVTNSVLADPAAALRIAKISATAVGKSVVRNFSTYVSEALLGATRAETARKVIKSVIDLVKANKKIFGLLSGTVLSGSTLGIGLGLGLKKDNNNDTTRNLAQELNDMFELLKKYEPLIGKDGINAMENNLVKELVKLMTEGEKNMYDNSINGFQNAFSNVTGSNVNDVIEKYSQGDISVKDKFDAIVGTSVKALPKEFNTSAVSELLKDALEHRPLQDSAKKVVSSIAQTLYSQNIKSPDYVLTKMVSDLTAKISEFVEDVQIFYGDLPSQAVSDMQAALLREQFYYIQTQAKKLSTSAYALDVPESVMRDIAKETYNKSALKQINGLQLIYESDTIKAYKDPNSFKIIIGLRGTADTRDVKAWIPTGLGQLSKTARYEYDKKQLLKLFSMYSPSQYTFYVVGHSLGGALSTQFKRDFSFIKNAVTYNSAVSPRDYLDKNDTSVIRKYAENDILYNYQGGSLVSDATVGSKEKFDTGNKTLDNILMLWNMVEGHKMDNFFVDERRSASYNY